MTRRICFHAAARPGRVGRKYITNAIVPIAVVLAAAAIACGQDSTGGRIPVRVVAGRLVTTCDVKGPKRRIPANLFIEYDGAFGLQLHNRAAFAIGAETGGGTAVPIEVRFPDFALRVPRRELGDEDYLEEFTKYHSVELGENAVIGAIGAQVLAEWHVVFDLAAGFIELRPKRERQTQPPEFGTSAEGALTTPITIQNDLVWLPVRYDDGSPAALAVGGTRYDTVIDAAVCERFGRPAGDIGGLRVGDVDIGDYVALRPTELIQVHADGAAGVIGLNLLEHFRVEIDRVNRWAKISMTRPAAFPKEDLAFFKAMVAEDPQQVEAWLKAHPDVRLSREAAELLLALRLDNLADGETTRRALRWINDVMPKDLRATRMYDLMIELDNEGQVEYVLAAGEIGVESGRADRYPNTIHQIHGRLGDVLLRKNDDDGAWRHLLSGAFGIPDDGMINYNLGRVYERQKRYRRAFSRYLQAVIKPESGPLAIEGLRRVQERLPGDERFSVELVERMIAGKVRNFGAADKFKPTDENTTGRVVLVEFFTNAYLGNGKRGAIGGALGNQGLLSHFEPSQVVFLSHHIPSPKLDPLITPLAARAAERFDVPGPYVHVINGRAKGPGAGRWHNAEAIYSANRSLIFDELLRPSDYSLSLIARIKGDRVTGELRIDGPQRTGLSAHVIIAEKGVLFPGETEVVVHRMLARGSALDSAAGKPFKPVDGGMTLRFERGLSDIARENAAYLDRLVAEGAGAIVQLSLEIDPRAVVLVGFLSDDSSGEVLQVVQASPTRGDED